MERRRLGPFTGGQLTVIIGLAIVAPSAVYGAATFTKVVLQDRSGDFASVDSEGRLYTRSDPSLSTIVAQGNFFNSGNVAITSPTTASLAVTQLKLSETRLNGTTAGSDLTVRFAQYGASGGNCVTTTALRYLSLTAVSSGDHVDLAPASAPMLVAPIDGAQYCLGIYSVVTNGAADATNYYPSYAFTAYVSKGRYSGLGLGGASAPAMLSGKKMP